MARKVVTMDGFQLYLAPSNVTRIQPATAVATGGFSEDGILVSFTEPDTNYKNEVFITAETLRGMQVMIQEVLK